MEKITYSDQPDNLMAWCLNEMAGLIPESEFRELELVRNEHDQVVVDIELTFNGKVIKFSELVQKLDEALDIAIEDRAKQMVEKACNNMKAKTDVAIMKFESELYKAL